MNIISDHKPHRPWGGVVGVIRRHRDDGEPTIELSDTSIHEWLTAGERAQAAIELAPASVPAMPELLPSTPMLPLERHQVTVHRELDDDEQLTEQMLTMERATHSLADQLESENDARMTLLLSVSAAAVKRSAKRLAWVQWRFESSWSAQQLKRRRDRVRPLVGGLAMLLESGDVSKETAARIMSLRARYLSLPDESQRLPRLTPEVLAGLDAEKAAAAAPAPWSPSVGDLVSYEHPTQHRALVGTVVRLRRGRAGAVPSIRIRGTRTVFECLSAEGFTLLEGTDPEPGPACADCKGSGTYWWKRCGCAHGCSACDGSGHMGAFACPTCKGSGNAAVMDAERGVSFA